MPVRFEMLAGLELRNEDEFGGLPECNINLEEIHETEISRDEFLAAWDELPSFNRPWRGAS